MARGRKLPVRLSPDVPRSLRLALSIGVTLLILGLLVAWFWTGTPKGETPVLGRHLAVIVLLGGLGFACVFALARELAAWLALGTTEVEVSSDKVRFGDTLTVYVLQRYDKPGLRLLMANLVCLQRRGRGNEGGIYQWPLGVKEPEGSLGLRAQIDASYEIPDCWPPSGEENGVRVRWAIEIRVTVRGAAEFVERYPIVVQRAT